ncbi:MAG: hypothetical protein J3K34DRAFT_488192 [Monoraphidium minutum]|nr:MAG: hypothetical protein J3K34DRAFT_488192 [Monoraphidium minutum]
MDAGAGASGPPADGSSLGPSSGGLTRRRGAPAPGAAAPAAPEPQAAARPPPPPPPPGAALAAAAAAARRHGGGPLPISATLEFGDADVERAYRAHLAGAYRAADAVNLLVNLTLLAAALLRRRAGGAPPPPPPLAAPALLASAASAAQSAGLLVLLLRAPAAHVRWRGAAAAAGRLYRVAAWLVLTRRKALLTSFSDVTLRMFLLSPASSNALFVLFYPLPFDLHLGLLALTALAAAARGAPMAPALLAAPALPPAAAAAYERLTRLARYLDIPTHRLAPRAASRALSPADAVWCMHAFVSVVAGVLLPAAVLYLKDVHLRVSFLGRLQPLLPARQVAATRHALYTATLSACFVLISLVPCVWGVVQLVPQYCLKPGGGVRLDGVAMVLTVLALELFMRVWLLAVFSLLFTHGLRQALVWLAGRMLAYAGYAPRPPPAAAPGAAAPPPPGGGGASGSGYV